MLAALADIVRRPASAEGRGVVRLPTREESFDEQWDYETCEDRYVIVMCSRRAGKTSGAVRKAARVLLTQPGCWVHFVSLIKRNAKKHFFRPLMDLLDRLGVEYHPNETDLTIKLANGSWCQALGVDDQAGTKAVQGDKSSLFIIDECHLPNDDVTELLVTIAKPMLSDTGGRLELLGLPPEVEGGFFDRALTGGEYTVFSWTMFDHDFPRPREAKLATVLEDCRADGLPIEIIETEGADGRPRYQPGPGTHPTVLRQYFGRRSIDPTKQAYEYQRGRNDYDPAGVDFSGKTWRHAVGIDLGFQDHDAIVVVAWNKEDPDRRLYVRHEFQESHQDVDVLADVVREVVKTYRPVAIIADTGGHGATKVVETLKARLHVGIGQKPADVMVSVGLVNDDLRTGRLLLPQGCELAREMGRVTRTVNTRTRKIEINKKGFHSDLTEALRYAHAAARHWAAKAPKPEPTWEERIARKHQERRRYEEDPFA